RNAKRGRRLCGDRPHVRNVQAQAGEKVVGDWVNGVYVLTAICFILSLKLMNSPKTARMGNGLAAVGMAAALVATFFRPAGIETTNLMWLIAALAIGTAVGIVSARRVQMTAMPQMVALFNGLGGGAVALVATIEYLSFEGVWSFGRILTVVLSTLIGAVSFSGSLI